MATRVAGNRNAGAREWISILGDRELIRNMERVSNAMQNKIMRKAISKGLKPIAELAKSKSPEKTGLLKKSIKSKPTKKLSGKVYVDPKIMEIRNGKVIRPSKYAHLVELGTRHSAAKPFMRPALDAGRTRALGEIERTAAAELDKEVAKG